MSKFEAREALRGHMNEGHAVSLIEAMLLFGVQNPNAEFGRMKKDGFLLGQQRVPMAKVMSRLNKYVTCEAPKELPQREILMSEYWVKK